MQQVFDGIESVNMYISDIFIWGCTLEEHDVELSVINRLLFRNDTFSQSITTGCYRGYMKNTWVQRNAREG